MNGTENTNNLLDNIIASETCHCGHMNFVANLDGELVASSVFPNGERGPEIVGFTAKSVVRRSSLKNHQRFCRG